MRHTNDMECLRLLMVCVLAQTDINDNMRAILIDWLVEVHYKFRVSALVPSLALHLLAQP